MKEPGRYGRATDEAAAAQPATEGSGAPAMDRRSFLKAAGFTFAGALATGCSRAPVEKAIPFLVPSEESVPGRALWYAGTCGGCTAGCGVLVKCRDGRPIKMEGNPQHPLSAGGLCAVGQAMVLGLYDSHRLKGPRLADITSNGTSSGVTAGAGSWQQADAAVRRGLADAAQRGGRVRLLTETVSSPTERAAIARFLGSFADGRQVVYDPLPVSAVAEAHGISHGESHGGTRGTGWIPRYRFDRAEVIVSFDADFLGSWMAPVEHTVGYRAGRALEGDPPRLSYHAQLEARLSLTGSNADRRIIVAPGEIGSLLDELVRTLAHHAGVDLGDTLPVETGGQSPHGSVIEELAERLWHAHGRSLVVCGSRRSEDQLLTNLANHVLGNYGHTLDLETPSFQRQGDDRQVAALLEELEEGAVDALIVRGVNPLYDLPFGDRFGAALARVPLVVSCAGSLDETAEAATVVCPEHHPLESWRDVESVAGVVSVSQPAIRPLAATRAFVESLTAWSDPAEGQPLQTALESIREHWQQEIYPRFSGAGEGSFEDFWQRAVHDGFVEVAPGADVPPPATFDLAATAAALAAAPPRRAEETAEDLFTVVLYPKVGLLDGRHAENAWLQELPDPITKVVWDNYACLSPVAADRLGVAQGDEVRVVAGGDAADAEERFVELPVYIQPGQHDGIVAVALGYGRRATSRFADIGPRWLQGRSTVPGETVGRNGAPLGDVAGGHRSNFRRGVRVEPTGRRHSLATTQTHHTLEVPAALAPASGEPRPIIQETTLAAYTADPHAGAPHAHVMDGDLWADHPYEGRHWGMTIDLNACTGCSACVIACQVENNVPVVGKDEVGRRREMHWLRIDRYYRGEGPEIDIVHQPMICHHCDSAPCESVCPVLATVHSSEGLNQQVYNRCVGTRYCANNCPFKVRRFNWFDYPHDDPQENLVLNPDVVVRSRGVMEKCSFCVQRIQEAKHQARSVGRPLEDGQVRTACQQSCPAQAITFGDLNDTEGEVARRAADPRHYRLFEELNIQPSVGYLRRVRNRDETLKETHHG